MTTPIRAPQLTRPASPRKTHRTTPSNSSLAAYSLAPTVSTQLERSPTFGNFDFHTPGTVNQSTGAKDHEQIQNKTFCKWLNARLTPKGLEPLTDLGTDFCDGIRLIQLIEILTETPFRRYNKSTSLLKVQKAENLNLALDRIKAMGVQLTNIGAEDIIEGNRKLILGMIWSLVLRFVIADINEEGSHAKEGLLLWCQRKTAPYAEVEVTNFTKSWQDGLALCALIHRHRPDLLDYSALPKDPSAATAERNTRLAFLIAERDLGIPQLLEVEDVCGTRPDDRSVMTYVAQYFHAFSAKAQEETNATVINRFVERVDSLLRATSEYEARATKFIEDVEHSRGQFRSDLALVTPTSSTDTHVDAYHTLQTLRSDFDHYRTDTKTTLEATRSDVKMLLRNIQIKLHSYSLRAYEPPADCDFPVLDEAWYALLKVEKAHSMSINSQLRTVRERIAHALDDALTMELASLEELHLMLVQPNTISLEEQLLQIKDVIQRTQSLQSGLVRLEALESASRTTEAQDWRNTTDDVTTLRVAGDRILRLSKLKQNFLENQITARSQTNITPEQLEEFESAFRAFDKNESNTLDFDELAGALSSLGIEQSSHENYYHGMVNDNERINYESFVTYLVEKTEDRLTFEKVRDCFANIAENKPYITELDLTRVKLGASALNFFKDYMPLSEEIDEANGHATNVTSAEEHYDYVGFIDRFFE